MAARRVPACLRGVFAGAGSDGLNEPAVAAEIVRLAGKPAADVSVAYLGTATYDLPGPRERQTGQLAKMGCRIADVALTPHGRAWPSDTVAKQAAVTVATADVLLVSGGNTLFAVDTWRLLGIDQAMTAAMHRGAVLTGGSAGAICWFEGGHSDSADPDTYQAAMRAAAAAAAAAAESGAGGATAADESSAAPAAGEAAKPWRYVRVPGLGYLPGLVCPHYDKVQSNGVPRASDFQGMLRRHAAERGVCIDHWAALVVDGGRYSVLRVPGKGGSVRYTDVGGNDGANAPTNAVGDGAAGTASVPAEFAEGQTGVPGVWLAEAEGDDVRRWVPPDAGIVDSLLRRPNGDGDVDSLLRPPNGDGIVEDPACCDCRRANPIVTAPAPSQ